ncbi:MAG: hypothetical protein IPP48_13230 [Chitinophagaceae bacterium]|nr:hypothetical protein [Chitinophagaceae bacterium]
MKISILVFLTFLFSSTNAFAQDCTIYHKGYFTFTDSAGKVILMHRKKKYQYQYDREKKITTQYRIKWISDCEYTITQAITNSKAQRKFKNSITKVVISKTDGENGFYYKCACPTIPWQ